MKNSTAFIILILASIAIYCGIKIDNWQIAGGDEKWIVELRHILKPLIWAFVLMVSFLFGCKYWVEFRTEGNTNGLKFLLGISGALIAAIALVNLMNWFAENSL